MPDPMEDRRSKLSPERRALLEKRLRGLSATVGTAVERPGERAPQRPGHAPEADGLAAELAGPGEETFPIAPELWASMLEIGAREAAQLSRLPGLVADAEREPRHDRESVVFLCAALQEIGIFQQPGEEWTIQGLIDGFGLRPGHRKVLRRWMEALTEDGLLERRGDAWRALEPLPPPRLAAEIDEKQRAYYGGNLRAVLTGERHALEFYLSGGSSESVEASYREQPIFRYCNGISTALLAAQVRALPAERRLRVLEVGAGTGGTTASLLPVLPPERTLFVFTDVSKFFTDLGQNKFSEIPFLRFRELDIERDPVPQGFPAAGFDWIVAAHVLHATRRVAETLAHVRRLLAPGGVLLLLEETRFQRRYNFSMGFLPGFDRFEDFDLRPLHPLLTAEQWRRELHAAGFDSFASFTEPESAAEVMGVDVILARRPEREGPDV